MGNIIHMIRREKLLPMLLTPEERLLISILISNPEELIL